jgi:hypothetical protein
LKEDAYSMLFLYLARTRAGETATAELEADASAAPGASPVDVAIAGENADLIARAGFQVAEREAVWRERWAEFVRWLNEAGPA